MHRHCVAGGKERVKHSLFGPGLLLPLVKVDGMESILRPRIIASELWDTSPTSLSS